MFSERLGRRRNGYGPGMPRLSPRALTPHDTRESDQLPEEQPGSGDTGTSTPGERESQVGLDPSPRPSSRPNTGNPHDHD